MFAFCLRILAGMLFRGDDFFGFSFCICNSISLIVTGLNSKLVQFTAFSDLFNAGMIFIFLVSFFYWILYPICF